MVDSDILYSLPSFTNPERALNNNQSKGTRIAVTATLLYSSNHFKILEMAGRGGPPHSRPYDPQYANPRKFQRTGYYSRNQVPCFWNKKLSRTSFYTF